MRQTKLIGLGNTILEIPQKQALIMNKIGDPIAIRRDPNFPKHRRSWIKLDLHTRSPIFSTVGQLQWWITSVLKI